VGCGLFGLLHLQLARLAGASAIAIEKTDYRREAAARFGASCVLQPDDPIEAEVRAAFGGQPADVAIVATGAPGGLATALKALGRHGTVLLFGMPPPDAAIDLSLNDIFWRKELSVVSSYGAGEVSLADGLQLMARGDIDPEALITHRTPFSRAQDGFQIVAAAEQSLKVVLEGFEAP
jgi:L-iditol 2-dehydrogenase